MLSRQKLWDRMKATGVTDSKQIPPPGDTLIRQMLVRASISTPMWFAIIYGDTEAIEHMTRKADPLVVQRELDIIYSDVLK